MNIGDKIGLRNGYGDVVEFECVYVKPHPAKAEEARESDPWPHWYLRMTHSPMLVRHDGPDGCVVFEPDSNGGWKCDHTETYHKASDLYRRLPSPEAAALRAKWEADRKPPQPELPTADELASKVVQEVSAAMADRNSLLTYTIREAISKTIESDRQARSGERGG